MSFQNWCILIIAEIAAFFMMYMICCAVEYVRPTLKLGVLFCSIGLSAGIVIYILSPKSYNALNFALGIIITTLQTYWVFHHRGWKLLFHTLILLIAILFTNVLYGFLSINVLTMLGLNPEEYTISYVYNHKRLVTLIFCAIVSLAAIPIWFVQHKIRKIAIKIPDNIYVLRAVMLLVITILSGFVMVNNVMKTQVGERLKYSSIVFLVVGCMLVVVLSYLFQDIRYLAMRRRNETLEHQKVITDTLIADMRQFRHNIINMVYGYEGVLLYGTPHEQLQYYETMARDCARINNENILSLQRIGDAALSALLLNKLERARDMTLPIYLTVSSQLHLGRIPSSVLCQALGVLLDNAIEAADGSVDARVSVLIAETSDGLEFSVLNTYRDSFDISAFLMGHFTSTKPDHKGDGLKSIESLCRRYPSMSLSKLQKGRFIECVLMIR